MSLYQSSLCLTDLSITYPLDHSLLRYSWGWLSFQSHPQCSVGATFLPWVTSSVLRRKLQLSLTIPECLYKLAAPVAFSTFVNGITIYPTIQDINSLKIVFYSFSSSHSKSYQVLLGLPPKNLLHLSFLHSCCFLSLGLHSFSLTRIFSRLPQLKIIPLLPYTVLHS